MRTLLAVASVAFLLLAGETVAIAQDKPACAFTYDEITALFALGGKPVAEVPADKLQNAIDQIEKATGELHNKATRIFITTYDGKRVYGVEEDGCMVDPIAVGAGQSI